MICRRMHMALLSPVNVVVVIALLVLLLCIPANDALIRAVYNHNGISQDFDALPSHFGPSLHREGLLGYLVEAKPANACQPIDTPPPTNSSLAAFIALIQRYDCPFTTKVLHAQRAGYHAAIIHNVASQALVTMLGENEAVKEMVHIPSLFISESASTQLRRIFHYDKSAYVILIPECHWLSCGHTNCQSNPQQSRQGFLKQTFPCLPTRCHFFNSIHYLLFGLTLVIWVVALWVFCFL